MNIEMIWEYIDPQLIIVIPMLRGIGMAVKKSTIQNRFIPALLLAGSCSVAMLHLYSTNPLADKMAISAMLFAAVTQGSVIWLAAWLGYEKFLKDGGI